MSKLYDLVTIMKDLSLVTTDLVKCQIDHVGHLYKQTAIRLLTFLLLTLAALALAAGGLGFILWSIYARLAIEIGPIISGLVIGLLLIMASIIVFLIARAKLNE